MREASVFNHRKNQPERPPAPDYDSYRLQEAQLHLQLPVCLGEVCLHLYFLHTGLRNISIDATTWAIVCALHVARLVAAGVFLLCAVCLLHRKGVVVQKWNFVDRFLVSELADYGLVASLCCGVLVVFADTMTGADQLWDIVLFQSTLLLLQLACMRVFFRLVNLGSFLLMLGCMGGGLLAVAWTLQTLPAEGIAVYMSGLAFFVLAIWEYEKAALLSFSARSQIDKVEISWENLNFIGNVAHDLKTPLQAITSELSTLSSFTESNSVRQRIESIEMLKGLCNMMVMFINRSLDFVKAETGVVLKEVPDTVDLTRSMERIGYCINIISNKVPVNVKPVPSEISRCIMAEKQWLEDNLLCLSSNATSYTKSPGSIVMSVALVSELAIGSMLEEDIDGSSMAAEVGSQATENEAEGNFAGVRNMLLFEVEDTGEWLTSEKKRSLFKPVKQAERSTGGTGLGLFALAKRVDALGGRYGVRGRRDKGIGSLFWFSIPYRPLQEVHLSNSNNHVEKMLNVLLVDDSTIIQKTTSRALQREGYTVTVATNGAECLEELAVGTITYDVILLDMQMPVMDGLETIRRIRDQENEIGCQNPQFVLGCSAFLDSEFRQTALSAGMNDFITKPLTTQAMKDCCQKHGLL
jgi:CheY-like chemotaxis protein/signal transduction histidine kinase